MKTLLASLALVAGLTGCASTGTGASALQAQLTQACGVVQPTLAEIATMAAQPGNLLAGQATTLQALTTANAAVCSAVGSVQVADAKTLAATAIPAVIAILPLIPGIAQPDVVAISAGLLVLQGAVNAFISAQAAQTAPAVTATPSAK